MSISKYSILLFLVILLPILSYSQSGLIRGTVIEDESGEPLFGVTVAITGTGTGSITDFDGKFEIKVDPGVYNLSISYISFETINITDVKVTEGKVALFDNIRMSSSVEQLDEIVVTAEVIRSSEAALMTIKKKSTNLIDGISSAKFKKIGDSDAADAVKRVTGVSVEGGKYVFVRGLGDRYTKTMLNGMDIPGLDPDRNSLQIDIFPTNLLNNMVVYKTALAELPADFSGGLVNIETVDFPDEKILDVSVGIGYNPQMHFNEDNLSYANSSTDWLGLDDGMRALPNGADREVIPSPVSGNTDADVGNFLRSFNPNLAAQRETAIPNYSLGLTYGDQKTLKNNNKIGYILSTSYRSSRIYFDQTEFGEYQLSVPSDVYELVDATTQVGQLSNETFLLGGLAGIAYKTKKSKYKINLLHLQNGESKAAKFDIDNNSAALGQSGYLAFSDNLEYSERSLTNLLISGEHYNDDGSWSMDWKISPTLSNLTDPDIRKTAYTNVAGNRLTFVGGAGGNPSRIWRFLDETNLAARANATRKYDLFGADAKLKFGLSHVYKERDYRILSYNLQYFGLQPEWTGDANEVLAEENLYPEGTLYYTSGNNTPNPNEYNSSVQHSAIYLSNEFQLFKRLNSIIGLRAENYVQRHTGRDVSFANFGEGNNLANDKVLDALDLFPSGNFIYSINDKQNLRLSYARTIARPSFKELSFAQIIDPITNRIFNGGLFEYPNWNGNLTETRINNFDLRWEYFQPRNQLLSLSIFYKTFADPIELVRIPAAQTSNEFQVRNVGDGELIGAELEIRKNLSFISSALEKFSLGGNLTLVQSVIEMTELEFNSRKIFEKDGQKLENTRNMGGQAPYIVNASLTYDHPEKGLNMGFYYNVKGETLTVVGGGAFPDVYSEPFHSLRFSFNKGFGPDQRTSLSINVANILNDLREEFYTGFRAQDQIFSRFNPGTTISVGLKYSVL